MTTTIRPPAAPGTRAAAPARPRTAVHRVPVPRLEPPYDDEVRTAGTRPLAAGGPASLDGSLALRLPLAPPAVTPPPRSPSRAPLRLVPPPDGVPAPRPARAPAPSRAPRPGRAPSPAPARPAAAVAAGPRPDPARPVARLDDEDAPPRTPRTELPDPRPWAGRLVQGLVEVLAGERPATQVFRHVSLDVYADLLDAPRPARPGVRPAAAAVLTSLRVTEPADGVAEVSAVVRRGPRHRAVALRLEGRVGRWRCTALQVG